MKLAVALASVVTMIANQHGVDACLVAAITMQESGGDPWATRFEPLWHYYADARTGAPVVRAAVQGLLPCSNETERVCQQMSWGGLQVMGSVCREMGFRGPFLSEICDPILGITYGVKYLKTKLEKYDFEDAVSAFNSGSPTPNNRANYVVPILNYLDDYRRNGF